MEGIIMAKRRQRPNHPLRQTKEAILIVCEGDTEKIYFNALKKSLRLGQIDVKEVGGGSALKVVQYAQALEEKRKRDIQSSTTPWTEPYKHIWCVFDTEGGDKRAILVEAVALAKKRKYHIAVSNPCFEIWYLLHFTDNPSHANPSLAKTALQKHIPTYKKGQNIFKKLEALRLTAIERAERFHNPKDEFVSPTTTVYELVRFLYGLKI
jgi:hypothetical protein